MKLRVFGLINIFLISISLIGCENKKAEKIIACAAKDYLSCPISNIKVKSIEANRYVVQGCDKLVEIDCKGPTDGCSVNTDSGELIVYSTRSCLNNL